MSGAVLSGMYWVLLATVTALLPMRAQIVPGITLLVTAPLLIVWIGLMHGPVWAAIATVAFLSMFRNPLIYFWRRMTGRPVINPLAQDAASPDGQ